ncbi:MAG: baseplate J/gp47 family protein [Ruminococcus sp.]|nr:baseplate J/gp47 family protein [Ruminococcus sp.]
MLPVLNLDDEMYEEILRHAKNSIPLLYPEWTDYNEHDPGITFLELLSWLKEAQQFYMNHMDIPMQPKFLQLLGLTGRRCRPASASIALQSRQSGRLLRGTPFYSGDICFTLTETSEIYDSWISELHSADGTQLHLEHKVFQEMQFYPFGRSPKAADSFFVQFSKALSGCRQAALYFSVYSSYPVKRNPMQEGYRCLAELEAQVQTAHGLQPCRIETEETDAFTVSGRIVLRTENPETIYGVRFSLKNAHYDVPPLLTGVSMQILPAIQTEPRSVCSAVQNIRRISASQWQGELPLTYASASWETQYLISDGDGYHLVPGDAVQISVEDTTIIVTVTADFPVQEILAVSAAQQTYALLHPAEGDGFPFQEYDLQCTDLYSDDFQLLIYDPFYEKWNLWRQVDSLLDAGHLDRVYELSGEKGLLRFGDGFHGSMPAGPLWIISLSRTHAEKGNLRGGDITYSPAPEQIWRSASYREAQGGAAAETPEVCYFRSRKEGSLPARAVTLEDYERLVYAVPGLMIRSCRIQPGADGSNSVRIAIEPYTGTEKAGPNPVYAFNLLRFLEERRLIGTQLQLQFPQYAEICIYAAVYAQSHSTDAEQKIRQALEALFETTYHSFGKPVLYSAVYAEIDLLKEVRSIQTLMLQCRNDKVKISRSGDLILPENGLAYLSDMEIKIISSM